MLFRILDKTIMRRIQTYVILPKILIIKIYLLIHYSDILSTEMYI